MTKENEIKAISYAKLMLHMLSDRQLLPIVNSLVRELSVRMLLTPSQWPTMPRLRNGFPSTGVAYRQMCLSVAKIRNFELADVLPSCKKHDRG